MGIFTGSDDKETQEYNDKLVASSLRERLCNNFNSVGDSISSLWKDAVDSVDHNLPDLWINASGSIGDVLSGLGFPGGFGHPARIRTLMDDQEAEEGTTGLYSYRTPSDRQYLECQNIKGLSVWDTHGWWRCLFPESAVRSKVSAELLKDVLTREKVEEDKHHSLGLFFTDYSAYLTWRTNMLRLADERRKSTEENARINSWRPTTPEELMDSAPGKHVVGTSEYVTYNTTPEGQEKVKETKTYYNDGSVKLRSEKQRQGPDGEPHVESFEKLLAEDDKHNEGWFWRK
ncbi:LAQU0S02e05534g1_1 [Lachancea quebecensis]|uniref:LAQU0S02e05534g1_1 n=1 Tax=Lachancea quebecensis TaxID=1654605 RepID=A0A0P1KMU6_9SACH|nr:LAQU0S02e05534g1_1 [Lachancea quebecensis]